MKPQLIRGNWRRHLLLASVLIKQRLSVCLGGDGDARTVGSPASQMPCSSLRTLEGRRRFPLYDPPRDIRPLALHFCFVYSDIYRLPRICTLAGDNISVAEPFISDRYEFISIIAVILPTPMKYCTRKCLCD